MNNFEYAEDIPSPAYEAWDQRQQETNALEELADYLAWWPKYQASLEALDRQKTLGALSRHRPSQNEGGISRNGQRGPDFILSDRLDLG